MATISLDPLGSTSSFSSPFADQGYTENDMTFRLLTLNCWGLKMVSKFREERMRYIANTLANTEVDIAALQECWVESDFLYMRQKCQHRFPYSKFFYSGIIAGPGLVVFSRFPIESVSMTPYTINGRPSAFFRGDWFVGKGVASAIIRHPASGVAIELFNTHMHAPYGPGDASYVCHRTSQAWQLARQIRAAVERGHLAIAVGDFNSKPDSLTYSLLTKRAGLQDSWTTVHGDSREAIKPESLSPAEQIETLGVTCDSKLNTWREFCDISKAQRLDYIFHEPHLSTVKNIEVAFVDRVPGLNVSASDHFGVISTIKVLPMAAHKLETGLEQVSESRKRIGLPASSYEQILDTIHDYLPTAHAQKYYRTLHFFVSIGALVALHIGIFWVDKGWGGFIMMLAATAIGITGVVDGMMGYLFGRNELRALQQFEDEVSWEMTLAKTQNESPDTAVNSIDLKGK
ncbi:Endonuclease/exonuclease/phosphatase [Myxozyma melibiosi]|uniref:Endonuclease/exonuclease/phosphatase n=1 Tax=Myxozyma melibiosi TaxID=54550 RepID=A0ABR1F177_9ASCO